MNYAEIRAQMAHNARNDPLDWKRTYIYGLCDPESGAVRYIGKSVRPFERYTNHLNERSHCHRTHWIQSLLARGLKPALTILEEVAGEWPWQEAERFWIARAKREGWPLVNSTSGGDGVPDLPPETRERMRKVWLGRKHSAESRAKIGAQSRLRRKTPEQREHMRRKMAGRVIAWADKVAAAVRKFDEAEVAAIKARLDAGEQTQKLAAEFKVHRTTISKIKMGTYHLPYRRY
jgi:hypothetical protein